MCLEKSGTLFKAKAFESAGSDGFWASIKFHNHFEAM
jgi:hypothetical protein